MAFGGQGSGIRGGRMTAWTFSGGLDVRSCFISRLNWMAGWERREGTLGRGNGLGGKSTGEGEHGLVGLGRE